MKKDIILFVTIFLILALLGGGTYALWSWNSTSNKIVGFNTSSSIESFIMYDAGSSHFVGNFQPSLDYCYYYDNKDEIYKNNNYHNTIKIGKISSALDMVLVSSIKLQINSIGTKIKDSNAVKWVVVEGEHVTFNESSSRPTCSSSVVAQGTFNGADNNSVLTLTSNQFVPLSLKSYTVYIWVDPSAATSSLAGETIDVNLWTQVDQLVAWYADVDMDGEIDATDYELVARFSSGLDLKKAQQLRNADVNGDGKVDNVDVQLVLRQISGYVECSSYWPVSPCPIFTIS